MDNEQLLMIVDSLQQEVAALKQQQQEKDFFDKHGAQFGGHKGIGMAILGELNRRGINTSAADKAVEDMINQMRTELSEYQAAIGEAVEKANAIGEALQTAIAEQSPEGEAGGEEPVLEGPAGTGAGGGELPPLGEEGGAEAGAEAPPPTEEAPPPPEGGAEAGAEAPPPEEPPPEGTVSDVTMKRNIRPTILSDGRFKDIEGDEDSLDIVEILGNDKEGEKSLTEDEIFTLLDAIKKMNDKKEGEVGDEEADTNPSDEPEDSDESDDEEGDYLSREDSILKALLD